MTSHPITIAIVMAFFTWMLWIGWSIYNRKHDEKEDFLIGGRAVSAWLVTIGMLMGWTNGFSFGFTTAMAYDQGWYTLWMMAGTSLPFLLLYIFADKIRSKAAESGSYMMGNYFAKEYSSRTSAVVGIANLIYFFVWLCVELTVGGQVLSALTGISDHLIVMGMGGVALLYLLLGGFLASVRTDLWQFVIFCVFMTVIVFIWYPDIKAWSPPISTAFTPGWMEIISITVICAAAAIGAPDIWQRIYSARSGKDAKSSCILMFVGSTLMFFFFVSLGLIIKQNEFAATSADVPGAIFTNLLPSWALAIGIVAFMAAIMSTVATTLFGAAMTLVSDIGMELKIVTKDKIQKFCRWSMIVILLSAVIVTFLGIDIITLAFTCLSVVQIFLPLIMMMFLNIKISERAAFWSLSVSLVAFLIGAYYNIYTGPYGLLPLGFAVISFIVIEAIFYINTKVLKM